MEIECNQENGELKFSGYMHKLEQRPLVGQVRRKFWFVLHQKSATLYWYKNADQFYSMGRILLSGAAFTFNPREIGLFEIFVDNNVHMLEASNNKVRMEWLRVLQQTRKIYYQSQIKADLEAPATSTDCKAPTSPSNSTDSASSVAEDNDNQQQNQDDSRASEHMFDVGTPRSVFYLNTDGQLTSSSLDIPPSEHQSPTCSAGVDQLLVHATDTAQRALENTVDVSTQAKSFFRRAQTSFKNSRSSSGLASSAGKFTDTKECERCKWKTHCHELTDELIAYQEQVQTLKKSLMASQSQCDALQRMCTDASLEVEKVNFALERERKLADMQFIQSDLRREIEALKDKNRKLEYENSSLNSTVEAYRDSVKTKDELILKFCDEGTKPNSVNMVPSVEIEVPEAILVADFGSPSDKMAQRLFTETAVNDVTEMKDLVDGYENQNKFLNGEVLALHRIIHTLEENERMLTLKNFNAEALYYQLKSRHLMVLNHFRSASNPRRLNPTLIQELIDEIQRPNSLMNSHGSHISTASSSETVKQRSNPMFVGAPTTSQFGCSKSDPDIDSLGFYLCSPNSRELMTQEISYTENSTNPDSEEATASTIADTSSSAEMKQLPSEGSIPTDDWMLRLAADFKRRSDDIWANIEQGNNPQYIDWLERWDSFLVNHVMQSLSPNPQLKELIRAGIPHAYRPRVWKSLVNFLVENIKSETGKGYYECLLRKAQKIATDETSQDGALKQIDLDIARTLPTNKFFDNETSEKVHLLRNVLYAFRFHNKTVEYCQGLNRLAAIGLLYLEEPDAFWFMVACVERLQPVDYYTSRLAGAVIDQRVLLDLIQEKIPVLWNHFRQLEIDLSLLTLSWFLTVFVDALSHHVYINIFDVFLLEGNKVLFRFTLAILKILEPKLLECKSLTSVHALLSNLPAIISDFKSLSTVAFGFQPFPSRLIENRRRDYHRDYKSGKFRNL